MILSNVGYDDSEYSRRYEELKQYYVTLPADPSTIGFTGLADLISKVQAFKDRVTTLMAEAGVLKANAKVQADAAKYAYETAADLLIDTDPEILALPSDKTKLARANKKLKSELSRMRETDMIFRLVEAYYKTVVSVFENLESSNRNLMEQCNLWKKSLPPSVYVPPVSSPGYVRS